MFGFGKSKSGDVRLTEKEIREMEKNMSPCELKEFKKRQAQAEADRDWDLFMLSDLLDDQGGEKSLKRETEIEITWE